MKLDRTGIRKRFTQARKAESQYNRNLRMLARQVGQLIKGLNPDGSYSNSQQIVRVLQNYAEMINPWATSVARMMLADVARRDESAWMEHSQYLGKAMRSEILQAPTGQALRELMAQQVHLITSLPLEAANRVHELATGAIYTGDRPAKLVEEILLTGNVTEGRARLIARTETSRAASNLLEARARYVGSDGYIWRTSDDGDVRPSHKKMEGKFVSWGDPPTLDNMKGHAGCLPNCRCWAEPVLPDL